MEITPQSLNNMGWSNCCQVIPKEEYEDVFSFSSQFPPPPLDHFSGVLGFSGLDFHHAPGMRETVLDSVPLSDMILNDPFYSPIDLSQDHAIFPEVFFCNPEGVLGFWDEMGTGYHTQSQPQFPPQHLSFNYQNSIGEMIDEKFTVEEKKKGVKRCREEDHENSSSTSSKKLSRKMISEYFYMPITQAARELNVGLTLLKKRCRELGIRRWPHRKLMSLQTLINNVQEFDKEEREGKLKESLQILEQEKKLMEEIPDMQLEEKTKRLRQSFFKANYKKRKLMGMVDSSSKSGNRRKPDESCVDFSGVREFGDGDGDGDGDIDEEFKYFLSDCFNPGF